MEGYVTMGGLFHRNCHPGLRDLAALANNSFRRVHIAQFAEPTSKLSQEHGDAGRTGGQGPGLGDGGGLLAPPPFRATCELADTKPCPSDFRFSRG